MSTPLGWQASLWQRLQEAHAQQRLTHALLLAGPAGIGKRRFAAALAQGLMCESPAVDGLACGTCRSCLQYTAGSHPNLFWLKPLYDDKTDKQKRDISVEQLRDLGDKLVLSSHYGGAKVVVFDPVDALNVAGVNALLKTIEEPPQATYLLLVSERPMSLAATLRSRCQRLRMTPPSESDALAWLKAELPDTDETLRAQALARAQGAPLRALASLQSGLMEQQNQWRRDWLEIAAQKRSPLVVAATVGREREQVGVWLSSFISFLGDMLRERVTASSQHGDLSRLAGTIPLPGLWQLIDEAFESARRIQASAAPQLVVESMMIAWWRWTLTRPAS